MKVLVLGTSGMLASAVKSEIEYSIGDASVFSTTRMNHEIDNSTFYLDAENPSFEVFKDHYFDFVINSIGIIKPFIDQSNPESVKTAVMVNSIFPIELSKWAEKKGSKVIQIATDCVFTGKLGSYDEFSEHDATDCYGKTKSLGEVVSPNVMHLRSSIIGRETKNYKSLVSWVCNQELNAEITGYSDHLWNGVTTKSFAKVCSGIIGTDSFEAGTQHLIPSNSVTKDQLVRLISDRFNRGDLTIKSGRSPRAVNMTLTTVNRSNNERLWTNAGYEGVPSIQELVTEM